MMSAVDPSASKTIGKTRIMEWLSRLMERAEVIAPITGHGGDIAFAPVSGPEQVLWDFENPLLPPKQYVLPQTDPVVSIRREDGRYAVEPIHADNARILLNIRSCDVKGMAFLERMHTTDFVDGSYVRRARDTILVSLACVAPCPLGFCVCCDAGPFLRDGFDVQLTDLGELLFAESGSEKGHRLLGEATEFFRPAHDSEISRRLELEEEAKTKFGEATCHFASAMRRISTGKVDDALWTRMADWCLECGGCNLACPTCYCFSVKDRACNGMWERCRIWDSCQYSAFTLEASGHNPREHRKDRMKRRFFHKVSAQYYQRDETVGCVGCGRCIKVCLGTTDMPSVVAAIRKGTWHG